MCKYDNNNAKLRCNHMITELGSHLLPSGVCLICGACMITELGSHLLPRGKNPCSIAQTPSGENLILE